MTFDEINRFWGEPTLKAELRKALYMMAVGVVLGMLAPYQSNSLPDVMIRFLYWIALLQAPAFASGPLARWLFPIFERWKLQPIVALLAFSLIISVPVFPIVGITDAALAKSAPFTFDLVMETIFPTGASFSDMLVWFFQVFLISALAICSSSMLYHLRSRSTEPEPIQTSAPAPMKPGNAFLKRLPHHLGENLICLSMEDHYIRVYADAGETLILMRLKDAAEELADYPGLQIHRSHWVAKDAIVRVDRKGRQHLVHLSNGLALPVSRSFAPTLKDQGIL